MSRIRRRISEHQGLIFKAQELSTGHKKPGRVARLVKLGKDERKDVHELTDCIIDEFDTLTFNFCL